jgi:hypothetical protein
MGLLTRRHGCAGGGREVAKRRDEAYSLIWKDSVDFVRLAARCDAVICPFGAVGADDAFDLFMDTDEILAHPVLGPLTSRLIRSVSGEDTDLSESVVRNHSQLLALIWLQVSVTAHCSAWLPRRVM